MLLKEMQIQNPTAVMIARTAVAQDDITGDGTSSTVLIIGELLKQAERYLNEGLHPRVLVEGFDAAKRASIKFLEDYKVPCPGVANPDKELLTCVARTALRSKLREDLADKLTSIVVDAVCLIAKKDEPIDLHMVEIMHMRHKLDSDTRLVSGLVLDHGARHPDMKKHVDDAFILTCNISMEYEKSEVNSSFMYSDAEQRERMVAAEREYTDDVVRQVIALKKKVCDGNDKGFVVITQKGIDPILPRRCSPRRGSSACAAPRSATWSASCSPAAACASTPPRSSPLGGTRPRRKGVRARPRRGEVHLRGGAPPVRKSVEGRARASHHPPQGDPTNKVGLDTIAQLKDLRAPVRRLLVDGLNIGGEERRGVGEQPQLVDEARATRLFIAERSNARERTARGRSSRLFYARQKSRSVHPRASWTRCASRWRVARRGASRLSPRRCSSSQRRWRRTPDTTLRTCASHSRTRWLRATRWAWT